MFLKAAISAFSAILLILALSTQAFGQRTWTPNLATLEGRLMFIQSLLQRHPNLISNNMQFRRNLLNAIAPLPELQEKLGDHAASWEIGATQFIAMQFYAADHLKYDDQALNDFKAILQKDLQQLSQSHPGELGPAPFFFEGLKGADFNKKAKQAIRLFPFMFDTGGAPLVNDLGIAGVEQISKKIETLDPKSIENLYKKELFNEHYRPILLKISSAKGMGQLERFLPAIESDFLDLFVHNAITPINDAGAAVERRAISIERISNLIAVLRGCVGGDCSIHSVPYFPLVKGTRTYWIRKTMATKSQPQGYAFAVPVEIDGKILPYVITVNGVSLNVFDVKKTIQAIALDWNVDQVVVPEFNDDNRWLVNTSDARSGMTYVNGVDRVVKLPAGWETITAELEANPSRYRNYYDEKNVKHARLVKLPESPNEKVESGFIENPYHEVTAVTDIARIERAILGACATENGVAEETANVLKILNLSEIELTAGEVLYKATPATPITAEQYAMLERDIGFKSSYLLKLDSLTSIESLQLLSMQKPEIATEKEWNEMWTRAAERLDRTYLEERTGLDWMKRKATLDTRAKVPPEYIQNSAIEYLNSPFKEDIKFALDQLAKVSSIQPTIQEKLLAMYEPKGISQIPDDYKLEFMRALAKMNPGSLKIQSLILKDLEERWRSVREDGKEKTVGQAIFDEVLSKITLNPGLEPALIALADTKSYSDKNGYIASSAQTLLSKLETPSEPALMKLVIALSSDHSTARLAAAQKLLALRPHSEAVLEGVVNALVYASHLQRSEIIEPITDLLIELHATSPIIAETIFEKLGSFRKIVLERLSPIILEEAGKHAEFQFMLVKGIEYGWPEDKFEVVHLMSQLHPTEMGVQIRLLDVFRRSYEKLTINKQVHLLQNQIFEDILLSMTVHPGLETELLKPISLTGDRWKYNQEATAYLLSKLAHPSIEAQNYMASNLYYPKYFLLNSILTSFEKTPPKTDEFKAKLEHARVQRYIPDEAKLRLKQILEPSAAHSGKCTVYETQ